MVAIVTRATAATEATVKGSPLTNAEIDQNFIELNKPLQTPQVKGFAALGAMVVGYMPFAVNATTMAWMATTAIGRSFLLAANAAAARLNLGFGAMIGLDTTPTANFTAAINSEYWLPTSITVTLPSYTGLPVGTFVRFAKSLSATPIIQATSGQNIRAKNGVDTSVQYNSNAYITFVFNGTEWEV